MELPEPDIYLGVGSGTHAEQTGKCMITFEKVLLKEKPDLVIVVGDVNSTFACALATAKFRCTGLSNYQLPVTNYHGRRPLLAHIEAGLRSFDRTMPEEINRLLTDAISDHLLTPCPDANENLEKEGIPKEKIHLVGNVMIDSLLINKEKAERSSILSKLGVKKQDYAALTLHRPSNVDHKENLMKIVNALKEISKQMSIVFPIHPRTMKNIKKFGMEDYFIKWNKQPIRGPGAYLVDPLGYLDFLCLEMNAKFVMTDSGGVQEETTMFNVPCLTLRNTTEWLITVSKGTNSLVGLDPEKIKEEAFKILNGYAKRSEAYKLWDGRASERIIKVLLDRI